MKSQKPFKNIKILQKKIFFYIQNTLNARGNDFKNIEIS
jgi:hypothetical protein